MRDERAFWSEQQLSPLGPTGADVALGIRRKDLEASLLECPRGSLPWRPFRVVSFIDVQSKMLFWATCGLLRDGSIHLADWGAWPKQHRRVYISWSPKPSIPAGGLQEAIEECVDWLRETPVQIEGEEFFPEFVGVDGGYRSGDVAAAIHALSKTKADRSRLLICFGRAPAPGQMAVERYRTESKRIRPVRKPGLMVDYATFEIPVGAKRVRRMFHDVNLSKSSVAAKARRHEGGARLTLSDPGSAAQLEHIFEYLLAESPEVTPAPGGALHEAWKLRPGERENHWLDCLSGCRDVSLLFKEIREQ